MSRTKEQLLAASNQVKNETQQGANTADRIGGILYDITEHLGEGGGGGGGGDTVTITPVNFTDGEKIADYSINGVSKQLKAPKVSVIRDLNQGTQIARITINGSTTSLFAPPGGGGGGDAGYQKVYFANVASGTVPSAPQSSDYDANSDAFTTSTPQWYNTNVNPQEGYDTYAIWVYFNVNGNIVTIDGPVCLTGAGTNGEDGEEIEWIYFRRADELSQADMGDIRDYLMSCKGNAAAKYWNGTTWITENVTFKHEDAVPLNGGWTDNAQGIDETNKYEYAAFRRSKNGNDGKRTWGDDYFHGPMLWSAFGKQEMDGDGVEYIFFARADGNFPDAATYNPQNWTNDEHFQDNEYIRANTGWMDDPIDLSQSGLGLGAVEWVSMRKKQTVTKNGVKVHEWQAYSAPAVWTRLAKDGGVPVEVDHTELYFKAMDTHTPPSQDASISGSGWYLGEDPNWGTVCPHLYCQEKTIYKNNDFSWGTVYYKGQWVEGGGQGQDGYTLVIDPSYAIFEETSRREDVNNNPITDSNVQDFDHYAIIPMDLTSWTGHVQILQGSTPQTIGFKDAAGQVDADGEMGGDNCRFKVTITNGSGNDPKGLKVEVLSITAQVTTAKMRFWVTLGNTDYCLVEIPIYINRLGTRFQYIVGDSETTIMKKTVFTDVDGTVYKFNNLGDYLRSSSENISTLKTTVGDSNSGLVYDVSQIAQTSSEISMSVQNGFKNYIISPMASTAYMMHASCTTVESEELGTVVAAVSEQKYHLIKFEVGSSFFNLLDQTVTIFMLVKCVAKDAEHNYGMLDFGWGTEENFHDGFFMLEAKYVADREISEGPEISTVNHKGTTVKVGTVRMGDSNYFLCYRTLVLDDYEQRDLSVKEFYISEAIGTWQVHSVGVVKGAGVPTIPSIINYNGVKSAGIDITNGQVDLIADKTTFSYYENGVKKSDKIWINNTTGTLHAIDGEFSGTLTAGEAGSKRIIVKPDYSTLQAAVVGYNDSTEAFMLGFNTESGTTSGYLTLSNGNSTIKISSYIKDVLTNSTLSAIMFGGLTVGKYNGKPFICGGPRGDSQHGWPRRSSDVGGANGVVYANSLGYLRVNGYEGDGILVTSDTTVDLVYTQERVILTANSFVTVYLPTTNLYNGLTIFVKKRNSGGANVLSGSTIINQMDSGDTCMFVYNNGWY